LPTLCRKVARKIVEEDATRFRVTAGNIETYLGKKRYRNDIIEGENEIGVTTGLAWTIVGAIPCFIETTLIPGNGKLVLRDSWER